jgi:nucleotide-binding universal stress UspA family protein
MDECMKIMIAYDGSPRAEAALQDLQYAGLPQLAAAKLVSVVEPLLTAGPPDAALNGPLLMMTQRETQQANWLVRQGSARLHRAFPEWACDTAVRRGNTALQIVAEALAWKPGLIVISPLNRSKFERLLLGSFSRSVVAAAPCSVRVARGVSPAETQGLRLLLGYDGSRSAAAAACEIALRRWPPYTEVRLVAVNPSSALLDSLSTPDEQQLLNELLEVAAGILCEAGLRVSLAQRAGAPKAVLLEEAAQWGAHCIFLGKRQRRGWKRFWPGSTAAAIAAQAQCSVEVVREDEQRPTRVRHVARAQSFELVAHQKGH